MIRAKSIEVLQAQVAAYGEYSRVENDFQGKQISEHAVELAGGDMPSFMQSMSHFVDEQGIYSSLPREHLERANYIAYLRKQAKEANAPAYKTDAVASRTALLERYATYSSVVSPILDEVKRFDEVLLPASERSEGYVTYGTVSDVYCIQDGEKELIVRAMRARPGRVDATYVQGALRARDIPAAEKLVAASYEHGVTIAEKIPGTPIYGITSEQLECVTEAQVRDFIVTVHRLMGAGISLDLAPGNVIYDHMNGFSVIDLQSTDHSTARVAMTIAANRSLTALSYILGGTVASYRPAEYARLRTQLDRITKLHERAANQLVQLAN